MHRHRITVVIAAQLVCALCVICVDDSGGIVEQSVHSGRDVRAYMQQTNTATITTSANQTVSETFTDRK